EQNLQLHAHVSRNLKLKDPVAYVPTLQAFEVYLNIHHNGSTWPLNILAIGILSSNMNVPVLFKL
ncbi:unnamed protein product, partial [Urochloa humidicola]